jgi:hypothetical protein
MTEHNPADRMVIDLMIAHRAFEKVQAAYVKAEFTAQRRRVASAWADMLLPGRTLGPCPGRTRTRGRQRGAPAARPEGVA